MQLVGVKINSTFPSVWQHVTKCKMLIPFNSEILLLGINPTGRIRLEQADVGIRVLTTALFIIGKRGIIDLNVHHTGVIKTNDGTGTSWQWNTRHSD